MATRAAYSHAWYEKNKVAVAARGKAYRAQHKAEVSARQTEWRKQNKDKVKRIERDGKLRRAYGVSLLEWDELFFSQGRRCAVCAAVEHGGRGWSTDHDHATGKRRGILCHRCNIAIGYLRDSAEIAEAAAAYLKLHGGAR